MDYKQLEAINKEFAEECAEMQAEFTELFSKWMKKAPRTSIINSLAMPIGIILAIMEMKDGMVEQIFPELPDVWRRYLSPWIALRDKWGKIPSKQFIEEYGKLHGSQYDEWFPTPQEKANFEEWYREQHRKNSK